MAVGIPGTGINGVFYSLLALMAPLRELPRALAGKSDRTRARTIARLFATTAVIYGVLALEYRLFERVAESVQRSRAEAGRPTEGLAKAMDAVAPRLVLAPFVILATVLLGVEVLRLVVRTKRDRVPRA